MSRPLAREKAKDILGPAIIAALEAKDLQVVYKGEYQALRQAARHETDPGVRTILKRYGIKFEPGGENQDGTEKQA